MPAGLFTAIIVEPLVVVADVLTGTVIFGLSDEPTDTGEDRLVCALAVKKSPRRIATEQNLIFFNRLLAMCVAPALRVAAYLGNTSRSPGQRAGSY